MTTRFVCETYSRGIELGIHTVSATANTTRNPTTPRTASGQSGNLPIPRRSLRTSPTRSAIASLATTHLADGPEARQVDPVSGVDDDEDGQENERQCQRATQIMSFPML